MQTVILKKSSVSTLISDKVNFRAKKIARDKYRYCIMIKIHHYVNLPERHNDFKCS